MNDERRERRWKELRWWEVLLLLGIAGVFVAAVFLPALMSDDTHEVRRSCQRNLQEFYTACAVYAEEHGGTLPPVQLSVGEKCSLKNRDVLMVNGPSLVPDYLVDVTVLVCPSRGENAKAPVPAEWMDPDGLPDPCKIDDSSYVYTGWRIEPEYVAQDGTAFPPDGFIAAFRRVLRSPSASLLDREWTFKDAAGAEQTVSRLRFAADDPDAIRTPFAMDTFRILGQQSLWNHVPPGGNVLYLDGHVEFVRYGEEYPYVPAMGELLRYLKAPESDAPPVP